MFCNNCGQRGHVFRDCGDPILSCGVILVRSKVQPVTSTLPILPSNLEVLMVRRRDSMTYTEFVRGKYEIDQPIYLRTLFQNMTIRERERIRETKFDDLWTRLWGQNDRKGNDYRLAKEKFELLDLVELLNATESVYIEPEWGFPKGRRIRCETDVLCAEREFFEETNVGKEKYIILENALFQERFIGTNGIPYQHKYVIAVLQQPFDIRKRFTPMQAREISAIGWKSITDCMKNTRPHYTGREVMMDAIVDFLQTIEFENNRR